MTTTYQTIPTEPTTASAKSRKGLVFGVAAAAFLLGVAAAVSTASKPTASTAFSDAALHKQDLKSFKFYDHDDRFIDFPYLGDAPPLFKAVGLWTSSEPGDRQRAERLFGHISNWDTSEVTTMEGLFSLAPDFNDDITAWNTSNVTTMFDMFSQAYAFNQPIGNWDVSKVTDMSLMFSDAKSFNQDLSGWDVGNVDDMTAMFIRAESFDQNLGWCMESDAIVDKWFNTTPSDGTPCFDASCGVHVKGVDC